VRRKSKGREHLGQGTLSLDPAKCVFINCPFDKEYKASFDAIVFATTCCGFLPRCALESGDVAEPRMARITRALFGSRYSIHDLSRCTGRGDENLARFNMPLELGIAMAIRFMRSASHDWLVLVPAGHAYNRFVSDLAGFDPSQHDGSLNTIVAAAMAWLVTRPEAIADVTPRQVLSKLPEFQSKKKELERDWGGYPPWEDIVLAAIKIAKSVRL
jgi:hypothetical protein